jgi:spore germination protein Q
MHSFLLWGGLCMSTNFGQQPGFNPMFQQGFPQQGGQFFPQQPQVAFPQVPSGGTFQTPGVGSTGVNPPGMLPIEQSYIENILRLNKGKLVTVYMTFEGSNEWNSKVFRGVIEAAGRDHLILSDPESGFRYLLPMIYFNYAVFEEEIEYYYPSFGMQQPQATYPPR